MQSKSSSRKSAKGSAVVLNSHNRLQLRFRFGGKRHYISLGLADSLVNRRFAELKAAEIEQDILKEKFDTTLEKYKSASEREKNNLLKACCKWSVKEGLLEANPFAQMTITLPKGTDEYADINPFSREERDLIIQTFAGDRYYSFYTPYVQFLFLTGCRPSEAIALQWKHINSKAVQFRQSVVISEEGLFTDNF